MKKPSRLRTQTFSNRALKTSKCTSEMGGYAVFAVNAFP